MTGKEALNYVINEIDISITKYHHPFFKTRERLNVIKKDMDKYLEALNWLEDYIIEIVKDPIAEGFNDNCKTKDGKPVIELFKEILNELHTGINGGVK